MRLFGRSAPRRPAARLCVAPLSGRCERFRTFSKPIARSATCLADYSVDGGLGRRMVLVARRRNLPDAFLRYDTHAALIARGGAGKRQARGGETKPPRACHSQAGGAAGRRRSPARWAGALYSLLQGLFCRVDEPVNWYGRAVRNQLTGQRF